MLVSVFCTSTMAATSVDMSVLSLEREWMRGRGWWSGQLERQCFSFPVGDQTEAV